MKAINEKELDLLIETLNEWKGAQVQAILGDTKNITLKIWKERIAYLSLGLDVKRPYAILYTPAELTRETKSSQGLNSSVDNRARSRTKEQLFSGSAESVLLNKIKNPKPLHIFFKAHFLDKKIKQVRRLREFGRVLEIELTEEAKIVVYLFPRGTNIGLISGDKKIFLKKPKELIENQNKDFSIEEIRSPRVFSLEVFDFLKPQEKKIKKKVQNKVEKSIQKIDKAIAFIAEDGFRNLAEKLKNKEPLGEEEKKFFKKNLSQEENIQAAYAQQKTKDKKLERLYKRRKELVEQKEKGPQEKKPGQKVSPQVEDIRKRIFWPSKDLRSVCGKSALENLKLLRASKPWNYWLHLKDYPSGHLIIENAKGNAPTDEELRKCALFLFEIAAPKKIKASENIKFEVVFTECKFVKPIKGENGKVRYSRTQSRLYTWSANNANPRK